MRSDEVTRLIIDSHDAEAFAPVSHLTVGDFRNWLLSDDHGPPTLTALRRASRRKWWRPCPSSCATRT
jgi:ethanolamine ammonia-lyase large subunit